MGTSRSTARLGCDAWGPEVDRTSWVPGETDPVCNGTARQDEVAVLELITGVHQFNKGLDATAFSSLLIYYLSVLSLYTDSAASGLPRYS